MRLTESYPAGEFVKFGMASTTRHPLPMITLFRSIAFKGDERPLLQKSLALDGR